MNKTVKNYTQSELFKLANQIRKSTGCSQKEAYHKAKNQLENPTVETEKKTRKGGFNKKVNQVRVTDKTKKHALEKYNLTVGQTFSSVKSVADHMKVSVQNVYGYIRVGFFESVN